MKNDYSQKYIINPKNKINPFLNNKELAKHKKIFLSRIKIVLDFAKSHPNFDDSEIIALKKQIDKYSTMDSKQHYDLEVTIKKITEANKYLKNPRHKGIGQSELDKIWNERKKIDEWEY